MKLKQVIKKTYKFLPDKLYVQFQYFHQKHRFLNLKNPRTFDEKIQWLKLYDRQPIYTVMVDKCEAKNYVKKILGSEYIIPTLGVWENFDDIDFDSLPNQFVLKCTHDSGGLVICRDKNNLDIDSAKKKINSSLKRNYYYHGREWPYKNVKPRIIAEQYIEDSETVNDVVHGLIDYKFYCFNGKPQFLYVSKGLDNHATARISFLTLDWEFAPFERSDFAKFEVLPPKPTKLNEMIKIAEKLSNGHKFLRVDLYQVGERILFSEFTFSPCNGTMPCKPKEWEIKLGDLLALD